MQELSNALADVGEGITDPRAEEYTMMLEVTMADCPGRLCPPMFSWNAGMVMQVLKNDPVLSELKHMQVDDRGTAYLFFYDKQGHHGLGQDTAYAIWAHVEEAFSEWISCSAHFTISLLPLVEAWWCAVAVPDHRRLRGRAENPAHRIPVVTMGESNSLVQLVGSTPQQAGRSTTVEEMASMRPHIFASLRRYPGKWAHTLDKGKDISVQDLLMHMEKTFGNKHDYNAMIRTLYEVQQKEDKTVEEYMLCIHDVVAVVHHMYPERFPDHGRDLKKDRFYHGLRPYLHDAISFAMAELPKREQACPTFNTLYTLAKKLEAGQPAWAHRYTTSSDAYREKHRCYPVLTGRVVALEEEGVASADPASGEDSESEVEAVDGLNVCLAQAMSCYQREEQKCFVCGSPGHFARDCRHHNAFKRWHQEQLNTKGAGENNLPTPRIMN